MNEKFYYCTECKQRGVVTKIGFVGSVSGECEDMVMLPQNYRLRATGCYEWKDEAKLSKPLNQRELKHAMRVAREGGAVHSDAFYRGNFRRRHIEIIPFEKLPVKVVCKKCGHKQIISK